MFSISACLSGLPFSFDELILETAELFEKHGIPGFLKVLIAFTDNMVVEQWKAQDDEYKKEYCCKAQHLNRMGVEANSFILQFRSLLRS